MLEEIGRWIGKLSREFLKLVFFKIVLSFLFRKLLIWFCLFYVYKVFFKYRKMFVAII